LLKTAAADKATTSSTVASVLSAVNNGLSSCESHVIPQGLHAAHMFLTCGNISSPMIQRNQAVFFKYIEHSQMVQEHHPAAAKDGLFLPCILRICLHCAFSSSPPLTKSCSLI